MLAARIGLRAARTALTKPIHRSRFAQSQLKQLQPKRFASSRYRYRYQRFGDENQYQQRGGSGPVYRAQQVWRNYRYAIVAAGGGGAVVYVTNLEEVPITHRRRFNLISPELEKQLLSGGYEQVLQEYRHKILPENHPYTQLVAKVVERILPATGMADEEWVVHVIDEPNEKNAFVMAGGKVFVFTGILPICQDENGLAAVLGHEIAHNAAHHLAEKMSNSFFVAIPILLTAYVFDVSANLAAFAWNIIASLPNSRAQEAEADHIGLLFMAESCYDPEAAVDLWKRMAKAEKNAPPQFLSTHPSSYNRADTITAWLPEAKQKYEESRCTPMIEYTKNFNEAYGRQQSSQRGVRSMQQTPSRHNDDDDLW